MEKLCRACSQTLPVDRFARNRTKTDGLNYRCRDCAKKANAERYVRDKARINAQHAEYRQNNVEKERARHRVYQQENAEQCALKAKRWRKNNSHRSVDVSTRYRQRNPEKAVRYLFSEYEKRALKHGHVFDINFEQFEALVLFSRCYLCGMDPETDANGLARLGVDRIDNFKGYILSNVAPCCKLCNRFKNNLPLQTFFEHVSRVFVYQNLEKTS